MQQKKEFSISSFNQGASLGIYNSLLEFNPTHSHPFFICIGSDLVMGDSLGPLVGTLLKKRGVRSYVYGTLNFPITAKEVEYARTYLKQMHPSSISIAIDAAVGSSDDVGLIKVINKGLKPGLGVNKNLGIIGDVSIIGIVAKSSFNNRELFNLTRLNLVYKMAEIIADGIEQYIKHLSSSNYKLSSTNYNISNKYGT
jgi:putative sporulation protein YyaC